MKHLLILSFLLISCSAGGFMTKKASVDYDKFDNETTYRSGEISVLKQSMMSKEYLYLRAIVVNEGTSKEKPNTVSLIARGLTTKLTFNELNELHFIIDGETKTYQSQSYSSDVTRHSGTVGFNELNIYSIPIEDFNKIANQEVLEGKLSVHEFTVSLERRTPFREFLAQFN